MKPTPKQPNGAKKPKPVRNPADDAYRLYKAVCAYVKRKGGNVLVAGGIEIHHDPTSEYRFKVAVQCTGRKPNYALQGEPTQ